MKNFDEIDLKILIILLKDGRRNFQEIAKETDISKNAVSKRYRDMQKKGIVVGSTVHYNLPNVGLGGAAEIIVHECQNLTQAMEHLQRIPEIGVLFYDPFDDSIITLSYLKAINDFGKIKEILRQNTGYGKIRSYLWEGIIINQPENLSVFQVCDRSRDGDKIRFNETREIPVYDDLDMNIIEKLTVDGRLPFSTIAKNMRVTTDTVARRYKRLVSDGTIKVVIQIDPKKIGYQGTLDSRISLKSSIDRLATAKALSEIPDVFCIVETSGDYDFHVWSLVKDVEHLLSIQEKISKVPDFGRINSKVSRIFMDAYPGSRQFTTNVEKFSFESKKTDSKHTD